jgi:hypothetical protein
MMTISCPLGFYLFHVVNVIHDWYIFIVPVPRTAHTYWPSLRRVLWYDEAGPWISALFNPESKHS